MQFDLQSHFLQNGVSQRAYAKMADDVESGDMSAMVLSEFNDDDLSAIANGYELTVIQKKTFIRAVKLLPQYKHSNNSNNNSNTQSTLVSAKDENMLNEISSFCEKLQEFSSKQFSIKNSNKDKVSSTLNTLKKEACNIKHLIDNIVNSIEKKVCCLFFLLWFLFVLIVFQF